MHEPIDADVAGAAQPQPEQTLAFGADPQRTARVLDDRRDVTRWSSAHAREPFTRVVEPVETTTARADPQLTAAVLEQCRDLAVGDRRRVERVVAEDGELIAVIPIQPVLGAEPHEPTPVLH